jgi:phosphate transport system protein
MHLVRARGIIAVNREIVSKCAAVQTDCFRLIATQQPIAGDLRTIAAILEVVTELNHIYDYAKVICIINLELGEERLVAPLADIHHMATWAQRMLRRSLVAFVRRDIVKARAIAEEDSQVDALYMRVQRSLMTRIIADPKVIDEVTALLKVAHNVERTADRVTNICERVIFTVTGELVELNPAPSIFPLIERSP